ncbi:MAG TPA: TonB-dependent receptor, partial [Rhodothermales bacterium]
GVFREDLVPTELASLVDVADTTGLNSIFVQSRELNENNTAAQLNVQLPFRIGRQVTGYFKTGGKLRWLDRENDEEQNGRGNLQYGSGAGNLNDPLECIAEQLPDWDLNNVVGTMGVLPFRLVKSDYSRDDFLDGDFELALVPDRAKMEELARALTNCEDEYLNQSVASLGRDYDGVERYQAAYAMAEFHLGRRITFLPGVRWERDYSRYHGQRFRANASAGRDAPPDELTPLTIERDNSFVLPMAHLKFDITDWLDLRLAYTETLTRPDYIQYAPITRIDVFRSSINANNSTLKPAHARNYDAAVSVHDNQLGLFTVAAFHKSIDDLIHFVSLSMKDDSTFAAMFEENFAGTNVPRHWYEGAAPTLYTFRNNPYEATYTGFEIDWQTNFWYLPSFLKGIVLNANYTYITSETTYEGFYARPGRVIRQRPLVREWLVDDTLAVARMNDQPRHIANVTIGYDLKGFSSRLSFLWQTNRSTYVDPLVPGLNAFSGDYFRVDLALRQKVGEGLELFANLNNLNGRPDRNFRQSPDATNRPDYIEYYGFTMDLGARYRF